MKVIKTFDKNSIDFRIVFVIMYFIVVNNSQDDYCDYQEKTWSDKKAKAGP